MKDIILEIHKKINKAGGKLYLVGGAVRDMLIGKNPNDLDFCITGIEMERFKKIFPEAKQVGVSFPVFLLEGYEFAFARTEKKTGKGYKGFSIDFSPSVTIEDDLYRRDLTINSMAIDMETYELIDPFRGAKDLESGLIRATSEAFGEDPLRVYRAARFAAKYGFRIDKETIQLMNSLKGELATLPPERVYEELNKALAGQKPSRFFDALREADCLDVHFKEIADLIGVPQPEKYHPEGDAYTHSMLSLDAISELTDKANVKFAMLAHDLGKGLTPKTLLPRHHDHDKTGVVALEAFCNKVPVPKAWKQSAMLVIQEHMRIKDWKKMRNGKLVKLFEEIRRSPLTIDDVINVLKADQLGRKNHNIDLAEFQALKEVYTGTFEKITGKMIDPWKYKGRAFGEQLFQLRCRWVAAARG